VSGCTTAKPVVSPTGAPKKVTLFFTAELRGFLGPCGCSENMRGGISRAAFQVAEARKAGSPVYLVDTGDGLFGTLQLPEDAVPQQERKAKALAQSWKAMGLTLRATGPLDDARGAAFRQSLQLPELPSGSFKVLDGVALVSAPTTAAARTLAAQARTAGARFVTALVPLPFPELTRESFDAPEVDLFVSSRAKDAFAAEESKFAGAATKVAQVQSKGRSLLRVDVFFNADGKVEWLRGDGERDRELYALDQRIELLRMQVNEPALDDQLKALRKAKLEDVISRRALLAETPLPVPEGKAAAMARFIPLESNSPKDPAVQEVEKQYDVDVGQINLAWAKANGVSCPPATADRRAFVGTAVCVTCHAEADEVFKKTKHQVAFKALVDVGKQYHLDCVGCHVTGWKQPGGVCRIDETAGREEVGCESCHGPGDAHAKQPMKTNIARGAEPATCVGCHDRENSPQFDFDAYAGKIVGRGHGQPR
jgi:hypothetical protein